MKKFIITGLFVATLFTVSITSCSTDEDNVTTSTREVLLKDGDPIIKGGSVGVKIGFGRTSKACGGIGICKIKDIQAEINIGGVNVDVDKAVKQVQTFITAQKTKSGSVTTIRFEFINMKSYAWAKEFFNGNSVIMEEDTYFNMNELNSYGFNYVENFTVPAGTYPMTLNAETNSYGFTFVSSTR